MLKTRLDDSPKAIVSPYSRAHEPFRMLRLSVELSTGAEPGGSGTLVFTSSKPGEGKSTISANYAAAAAHGGRNVLLIDADVRRPSIHAFFGAPVGPGLVDALVRGGGDEVLFTRAVPRHDGLSLLTAGVSSITTDVIASNRMRTLLSTARSQFDTIVIDTPPVLLAAETLALATFEGVRTIVVATPTTQRRSLRRSLRQLDLGGADVAGIVMNRDGRLSSYGQY
jgi:capsular exopolysaccharide synthesis family protein